VSDKVHIIAEIGINHNGDLNIAKELIDKAVQAGCDYVKFQKRSPDLSVPERQKNILKQTPWGQMSYIDYKHRLEFGRAEYDAIDAYCQKKDIKWFASIWDKPSADFMKPYGSLSKVPSAMITDLDLLTYARQLFDILIISTGMSTETEIEAAVQHGNPDVIMHSNSTYPCPVQDLRLKYISWLQEKFQRAVGYSGHEYGLTTTFATIALGVTWIERHITLDRTMWGSDQLASVEPIGFIKLVKGVRAIEKALTGDVARTLSPGELLKKESLRK